MILKAAYSTRDLCSMTGLSRHAVLRLKRRHGWGRVVYLSDLRDLGPLWESIILREQLSA
jgi:hypothetical protein